MNLIIIDNNYKRWIKNLGKDSHNKTGRIAIDSLDKVFPSWKETKKPKIYFWVWSIGLYLNVLVSLMLLFLTNNIGGVILGSYMGYHAVYGLLYMAVKRILKNIEKRKCRDLTV
jgi:hypothetical protein